MRWSMARSQAKMRRNLPIPVGACSRMGPAPPTPTGCAEPRAMLGGRGGLCPISAAPVSDNFVPPYQGSQNVFWSPGSLRGEAFGRPSPHLQSSATRDTYLGSTRACGPCREHGHHFGGLA